MAEGKNTVFVELYDLTITERKDDRFGRVLTKPMERLEDLIRTAVSRRTDLNAETLRASYNILKDIALEKLTSGSSVEFGMGYYGLGVNGVFISDNAQWDTSKHNLAVRVTPSAELRKAVKATSVKVRGMASSGAYINTVTDVASGEENSRLTPGGAVNLTGSKIKITGDAPGTGIFLTNQETGETTEVASNFIPINEPSKITFVVPAGLPAGDYKLGITTQFTSSNKLLNEPRTCTFDYVLAVIP